MSSKYSACIPFSTHEIFFFKKLGKRLKQTFLQINPVAVQSTGEDIHHHYFLVFECKSVPSGISFPPVRMSVA